MRELAHSFILRLVIMDCKESDKLRDERIEGTNNGATLRTRTVENKKKYKRKKKVEFDEFE